MTLEFIQVGNKFVAEFKTEADFNLHVEKENGELSVWQTTVEGGKYDVVKTAAPLDKVVDIDFVGVIYPKYIKVTCASLPTMAVVTFNE